MNKVIFIDRDGVINKDLWKYVEVWDEFEFIPGVLNAMRDLTDAGYSIIIISNQAGIGDGKFTEEALNDINAEFVQAVADHGSNILDMFYCVHGKNEGCVCRKPEIGLFEQASEKWHFEKSETYFIGDKLTDIEAGKSFGLKTILVRTGYGTRDEKNISDNTCPDLICNDLKEAVETILRNSKEAL